MARKRKPPKGSVCLFDENNQMTREAIRISDRFNKILRPIFADRCYDPRQLEAVLSSAVGWAATSERIARMSPTFEQFRRRVMGKKP